ncbi:beta strand repeat-containing protein [Kozakia baliensis]|uniref:beta strand repeat-containing protein n=1 Tax=Kozakia baliensis TaxID=153496 RepID=UPI000496C067|nr:hypothetical protein [Kozakia baliensis]
MAIVTVVGASGTHVQVTVNGGQTQSLAQDYANNILSASSKGSFSSSSLTAGSNAAPASNASVVQGIITAGGNYTLTGNYTHAVIGAHATDEQVQPLLSGAVTINGAGVTASSFNVLASDTAGVTLNVDSQSGAFVSTVGNNTFNAQGKNGNWRVATGDGNDTIYGSNGSNTISGGAGQNHITLGNGTNLVLSQGQDTIDGVDDGSTDTVTLMGGTSQVSLQSNSVVVDTSSKNNISVGDNSSVFGGSASAITFTGNTGLVNGAVGATISAANALQVVHGSDQDISVSGALQFISGTGNTSISAGTATVYGASGLHLTLDSKGETLFTANQPHTTGDEYLDASSSHGTLSAWTGAGNQTIIGGTGADHFVFGTQFDGTTGDSNATVTGGSGADNAFGVLKGHTGGDFTITDFGSAAGNIFFMYNYKPADQAKAIQDLLATATVKGGNTTLQLDNNAKVTFLGVNDLKATNINIS